MIRYSDIFFLVYNVYNKSSFIGILYLYNKIYIVKVPVKSSSLNSTLLPPTPPSIIIVSNKLDRFKERKVTTKEGRGRAKGLNYRFRETIAKGSVKYIFYDVIKRYKLSLSYNDLYNLSRLSGEGTYS